MYITIDKGNMFGSRTAIEEYYDIDELEDWARDDALVYWFNDRDYFQSPFTADVLDPIEITLGSIFPYIDLFSYISHDGSQLDGWHVADDDLDIIDSGCYGESIEECFDDADYSILFDTSSGRLVACSDSEVNSRYAAVWKGYFDDLSACRDEYSFIAALDAEDRDHDAILALNADVNALIETLLFNLASFLNFATLRLFTPAAFKSAGLVALDDGSGVCRLSDLDLLFDNNSMKIHGVQARGFANGTDVFAALEGVEGRWSWDDDDEDYIDWDRGFYEYGAPDAVPMMLSAIRESSPKIYQLLAADDTFSPRSVSDDPYYAFTELQRVWRSVGSPSDLLNDNVDAQIAIAHSLWKSHDSKLVEIGALVLAYHGDDEAYNELVSMGQDPDTLFQLYEMDVPFEDIFA